MAGKILEHSRLVWGSNVNSRIERKMTLNSASPIFQPRFEKEWVEFHVGSNISSMVTLISAYRDVWRGEKF